MNADGTGNRRLTDLREVSTLPRVVAGRQDAGVPEQRLRRPGTRSTRCRSTGGTPKRLDGSDDRRDPAGVDAGRQGDHVLAGRRARDDHGRQGDEPDLRQEQRLGARLASRSAAVGSSRHGHRRPPRHARHEGQGVRLPARRGCASRAWTCVLVDAGVFEPLAEADVTPGRGRRRGRRRRRRAARGGRPRRRGRGDVPRLGRGRPRGCTRRAGSTGSSPSAGPGTRRSAPPRWPRCPVGVPKLIVSTVASGDTRPYVGAKDVSMTYSVVDISGLNRISERILSNAAGRDRRDGEGRRPGERRGPAADRRDDVRRHDARRHARARAARGARLRGARLPRDRDGRPVDGGARARRLPRRRPRPDDDRARRRPRRRRALGRARPAGGGGRARAAAGRLARRARHGQLRPARDRAAAVRGPQPLRPQPDDHADAHDAGGVRRARARGSRGSCPPRPGRPRSSSR